MGKSTGNKLLGGWMFSHACKIAMLYASKYHSRLHNLVAPQPFSADIEVTTKCNSKCITCNFWKGEGKKRYAVEHVDVNEIEHIYKELRDIGIRLVGLVGAEPLLRKDIGDIVKKAKEIIGSKVYLTTNGILLEHKAEDLLKNGIDHLSVSIDGIGNTNDEIRGVQGHYERAIDGIKMVKELIGKRKLGPCECNIGTTIIRQNITEIPQLIDLADQLGTTWSFNLLDIERYNFKGIDVASLLINDTKLIDRTIDYMSKVTQERPHVFSLDPASLDYARHYLRDRIVYQHCFLGYFRLYIDCALNVYPGCWILQPVGNLKDTSLRSIIKSSLYKERVNEMYEMKCPGCTCGYLYNCMIEELPTSLQYLLARMKAYRKYM
jgi:MoaA/NifB/PqqE/SkfB family radical SAM enzyme